MSPHMLVWDVETGAACQRLCCFLSRLNSRQVRIGHQPDDEAIERYGGTSSSASRRATAGNHSHL